MSGACGRWWARHPRSPPRKTALHTKSAQTVGLEAIWCEVRRKILRNAPVWWLSGTGAPPTAPAVVAPPPTSMPNHPKSASPKLPNTPSGNADRNVMIKPLVRPPSAAPRRPPVTLPYTPPPFTPEKTALHTKSSQTAGLEAIWCEVLCKILRNTPVWWLSGFRVH
ncbi:hypothetical protein FRC0414_02121 [Corynebacterium diphtheriae]|nr:hypothetical protein FRC0414_02121 [Corynebacterium diphtheriae]